ncbi:MAG: hypothetical protein IKT42_06440 [Clostridia bacterium]|nr:hypothetical protein [Clostridia bacterium]
MAISFGFFNSVNDDRLYNAETFNTYFEGLISQNGVFENVGNSLAVAAGDGLNVTVADGKAIVNSHWVKLTAVETLAIATAHNLFSRYDMVTLRWNAATRDVTLQVTTGTPASTPVRPTPVTSDTAYEIVLAYVLVPANTTSLTTGNIYDQRPNTAVCGYITGLIDQVDITELFAQYQARFAALENSLANWQQTQQDTFDAWYYQLTQNLTVGAYIQKFSKIVVGGAGVSNIIPLDMNGYEYDENDVILPTLNGLTLQPDYDYLIDTRTTPVQMHINGQLTAGNRFEVIILKSNMSQTSGGLLTSERNNKFIHVEDAKPGAAHGFIVSTLGTTNEIAVANRNLFRLDQIETTSRDGLTFTKNADGSITTNGTSTAGYVGVSAAIDKNAFVVGQTYTISTGKTSGSTYVQLTLNYADNTTDYIVASNSANTFTVTQEVISASASVQVTASGTTVTNETIYPQIEVGDTAHDFEPNTYSTFTYDGETVPLLTDMIDNIWSNDDAVSGLQLVYIVLSLETNGDDIAY